MARAQLGTVGPGNHQVNVFVDDLWLASTRHESALHTLTPIGVAMAGKDVYDPVKD